MAEWITSGGIVDYSEAVSWMESRVEAIAAGKADETVWLLEHPSLFTAGTGTSPEDIPRTLPFPCHRSGRGGRVTYHGPGQRVIYIMLDLNKRGRDLRSFVTQSEQWIIDSLADLGVTAFRSPPHTGVWVRGAGEESKIAAIGFRIRRWISFHGASVNVNPELSHYRSIVPCGILDRGVTSLAESSETADMADLDAALRNRFESCLGTGRQANAAYVEKPLPLVENTGKFE